MTSKNIGKQTALFGFFFLMIFISMPVCAKEKNTALGPLIQTTTQKDEFLGLVHLELLKTEENYNGDMAQSIQNVLPSIVRMRVGNYWGSGVILEVGEDTALIASSRHLLQNQDFCYIKCYNGEEISGRVIYLSGKYDLGFVEADISRMSYEKREGLRETSEKEACEENLEKGSRMFLAGSADGVACNIYEGSVSNPWYYFDEFGSYMIYNYCRAKGGMSGGGTFDEHGHLIGIITGGREQEEETASLPMSLVREEWNLCRDRK